MITGYLDRIDTFIRGWALKVSPIEETVLLEILVDGQVVGEVLTGEFRQDLLDAGMQDGHAGFAWPIPESLRDGMPRLFQVRVKGGDLLPSLIPLDQLVTLPAQASLPPAVAEIVTASNPKSSSLEEPFLPDEKLQAPAHGPDEAPAVSTVGMWSPVPEPADIPIEATGSDAPAAKAAAEDRRILGNVEEISATGISGWVWCNADPDKRLTVTILLDGIPVGTTVADRSRSDLADAGIGDGSHAFSWRYYPGLLDGQPHTLEFQVDGEAIPFREGVNNKVSHQNTFLGAVDEVTAELVRGWAVDFRAPDRPAEIGVFVNEELIARRRCERFRQDIWQQRRGHGFYGFHIALPHRLQRQDYRSLRVVVLPGNKPLRIVHDFQDQLSSPVAPETKLPHGHLDRANRGAIAGWAVDEAAPDKPLTVDIHVNQTIIRSTVAANLRGDLKKAFPTSEGLLGYSYTLPYGLSLDGMASIDVTIGADHQSVRNSPMMVKIGRVGQPYESVQLRRHNLRQRRRFLAAPAAAKVGDMPRVCAIVLNRNGAPFLENLFTSLWLHNSYDKLEVLVVDHGSTDDSDEVCRRWVERIAIQFVDRKVNYSYSASNNFGVMLTDADILFFLNNDIAFDSDCISEAVNRLSDEVGIVGLKLATPPNQVRLSSGANQKSLLDIGYSVDQIQHLGVRISTACDDRPFIPFEEPINRDNKSFSNRPMEVAAVTAAALFIRRDDFLAIGGFHEEYFYGFEDVDLCLTARARLGKKIVCLNDQKAYHHRSASIERSSPAEKQAKALNRHIILRRLGAYVQATLKHERVSNAPFLRDTPLQIGFAVSEVSDTTSAGDYFTALELASELSDQFGFECRFVARNDWYDLQDCDVMVAMVDGFRPSQILSARSNIILIAWIRNCFDRWIVAPELTNFDEIWVSSMLAKAAFSRKTRLPVNILRIATKLDRFDHGSVVPDLRSDYCFTGSYFGSWRQIIGCLTPADLPYEFKLFGHNWDVVAWLRPYWQGAKPYTEMPNIYASTRIVIDDANHTTLAWGSTNSRVFDALAAGALVLTNSQTASDDTFDGELPVFTDRESLVALLDHYLGDEKVRLALVVRLRAIVHEHHSYAQRAVSAEANIVRLLRSRRVWLRLPEDQTRQLEPLQQMIEASFLKLGNLVQTGHSTTGLTRARALGAEVELRITSIEEGDIASGDLGSHRCNVLMICCELDRLRPSELKQYDILVTPDEVTARQLSEKGLQAIALSPTFTPVRALTAIERRLELHSLLERRLDLTLASMTSAIDGILLRKAEVPRAIALTLQANNVVSALDQVPREVRVAYVLWDFPALSQTFVLNEIRWLAERGHDVKVYFHTDPDRRANFDIDVASYRVQNADELASLMRLHERTVMHSPFAYPATTLLTYPASQATGIPFTMMPAGVDISHYVNIQRNKIAEVTQSRNCIGVITIGSFHHRFLVEHGVPEEKIILERQAVELPDRTVEPAAKQSVSERLQVISIGRMIEKKGFCYLVAAAQKLPEMDFIIYGYGPLESELAQLAQSLKVTNITFGGSLESREALWAAYAEADIFALACVRATDGDMDGLPTVLMEAMAAGVTVVSTRIANIPDLVVEGVTGFLCAPNDADDLASTLRRSAAMTPARRERLQTAARRRVTSYASVDRTMSTLLRRWQGRGVDIVLVTYDTASYQDWRETDQIISRIFKYTAPPFQIYVVDNGSTEDFIHSLSRNYGNFPNFHLIKAPKNIWCGPATNLAIDHGRNDYIIYLCSKEGYVLKRGWEQELVHYMEQNQNVGLAGHIISMPKYFNGETYQSLKLFSKFRNRQFAADNPSRRLAHVQGGIYILRRSVYEAQGGFSKAVPQDSTDIEYSYYLESQGVEIGDIQNVYAATTKTIPGVEAMLDENALVIHPLNAGKIEWVDRIVHGDICSCNVCLWQGAAFLACKARPEESVCPNCGSTGFSRTVLRLLSLDSALQRRPRTWAMLSEASLEPLLRQITTDRVLTKGDFPSPARTWPKRDGIDLAIIDHLSWTPAAVRAIAKWAKPFVADGGVLILGQASAPAGEADPLAELRHLGVPLAPVDYDSAVFSYDWRPIGAANMSIHP